MSALHFCACQYPAPGSEAEVVLARSPPCPWRCTQSPRPCVCKETAGAPLKSGQRHHLLQVGREQRVCATRPPPSPHLPRPLYPGEGRRMELARGAGGRGDPHCSSRGPARAGPERCFPRAELGGPRAPGDRTRTPRARPPCTSPAPRRPARRKQEPRADAAAASTVPVAVAAAGAAEPTQAGSRVRGSLLRPQPPAMDALAAPRHRPIIRTPRPGPES